MTKRFSAVARLNNSSFQSLHFNSLADAGEAANAAKATATMRASFMAFPGARVIGELRARAERGSGTAAMSRERGPYGVALRCPAAFVSSRSSEAAPGPAIASHRKPA